jgi:hypothetical protein
MDEHDVGISTEKHFTAWKTDNIKNGDTCCVCQKRMIRKLQNCTTLKTRLEMYIHDI